MGKRVAGNILKFVWSKFKTISHLGLHQNVEPQNPWIHDHFPKVISPHCGTNPDRYAQEMEAWHKTATALWTCSYAFKLVSNPVFTSTSSMENACQPRKFLCRHVVANLNMAKQLAHECHRNTTNWSTFSHVVGASGSALFKGGPPKKAQHHGWKRPIKSHHTTPTHIDKLVVPCRKLDRGTPHQVISGTIGLRW